MGIITSIITAQTPLLRLLYTFMHKSKKKTVRSNEKKSQKHQIKDHNKIKTIFSKRLALMS